MYQVLDEEYFKNKTFAFKEQFLISHPRTTFLVQNHQDALRLHHITGLPILSPEGKLEHLEIPQIFQYNKYRLFRTDKKILLWDSTTKPFVSVGWHFKAALEAITFNLFYQAYPDETNIQNVEVIITVGYWKRPKGFQGLYVLYDTETLHRKTAQLLEICQEYDYVFLTTLQDVEFLNYLGYSNVFWLPPAASPQWHKPINKKKEFQVHATLIGNYNPELQRLGYNRYTFLEQLAKKCAIFFGKVGVADAYVEKMWEAPLVLDRSTAYNIGTRVFEALSSGRFVITNRLIEQNKRTGIELLLTPGIHFGFYEDNPEACYQQVCYWNYRDDREILAAAASQFVRQYHTWEMRLSTLLRKIFEG